MRDLDALLEMTALKPGQRCVVIGCQDKTLLERLALTGAEIYAVDNNEAVLSKIGELGLPNIKTHYSRLVERIVHLPSNYFNLVIVVYRLETVEQRKAMLTEVNRLLTVGGRAIILTKLRGFFRRKGVKAAELEKLKTSSPFKMLGERRIGGGVVLLMERIRPPA
ncbi:MAG: methyltransferase domain-containing protein [Nitrososphaerota archaeon]